jgi:hypothetical protein
MTTITYPTSNTSTVVIGTIVAALAMLILAAGLAIAALSAPVIVDESVPAPAPMTNAVNSDDSTPLSGILEFAD